MPNQPFRDYFRHVQRSVNGTQPPKHPWYSLIIRNFTAPPRNGREACEQEVYAHGDYFQTQAHAMENAIRENILLYRSCIEAQNALTQLEKNKDTLEKAWRKVTGEDEAANRQRQTIVLNLTAASREIRTAKSELESKLANFCTAIITNPNVPKDHEGAEDSIKNYLTSRIEYVITHWTSLFNPTIPDYVNPTTDYYKIRRPLFRKYLKELTDAKETLADNLASKTVRELELNANEHWPDDKATEARAKIAECDANILALNEKITKLENTITRVNRVPNPTFRSDSIFNRGIKTIYPTNVSTLLGDVLFRLPAEGMSRGIDAIAGNNKSGTVAIGFKIATGIIPTVLSFLTHTVSKALAGIYNATIGWAWDKLTGKSKPPASNQVENVAPPAAVSEAKAAPRLLSPPHSYLAPVNSGSRRASNHSSNALMHEGLGMAAADPTIAPAANASNALSHPALGSAAAANTNNHQAAPAAMVMSARENAASPDRSREASINNPDAIAELAALTLPEAHGQGGYLVIKPGTLLVPKSPISREHDRSGSGTVSGAQSPVGRRYPVGSGANSPHPGGAASPSHNPGPPTAANPGSIKMFTRKLPTGASDAAAEPKSPMHTKEKTEDDNNNGPAPLAP